MSRTREAYVFAKDRWPVRAIEWLIFALAYIVRLCTRPLSARAVGALADRIGRLGVRLIPAFRRRAVSNLALVRPDMPAAERDRLVSDSAAAFARLAMEYVNLDRFARHTDLRAEGLDHLRTAHAQGKGVLVVTAHYGNWEAVRLAACNAEVPMGIFYRAFNNRYIDRFALRLIPRLGEPVLHKGPRGLRALIQHLRTGGAIMILMDQHSSGAPMIPFLGVPAETATTPAEVALRCGATILTAVARRTPTGFEVRIEPPVQAADAASAMAEVNERIGRWIEEEPAQWFWFHRRWKVRGR